MDRFVLFTYNVLGIDFLNRYHVHEKLQSFMAPIPAGTWHEEMVEELFSSLLGRKGGNLDDDEEDENETKEDEEQEDIPDDGLRIFG